MFVTLFFFILIMFVGGTGSKSSRMDSSSNKNGRPASSPLLRRKRKQIQRPSEIGFMNYCKRLLASGIDLDLVTNTNKKNQYDENNEYDENDVDGKVFNVFVLLLI